MHSDVKDVNQEIGKLYAAVEELRTCRRLVPNID